MIHAHTDKNKNEKLPKTKERTTPAAVATQPLPNFSRTAKKHHPAAKHPPTTAQMK
jgi:hypothetical protein